MQESLQTFGRYELLAKLARGGMGEIYLARFSGVAGFEKRCVIKKILPELAKSPTFVEKFLNEGRTLVALTHSNIVQIFDMGCENGEYYLAMEHIDGADLRLILKQFALHQKKIRLDLCCLIIMEVLKGLSYAHRATDANGNPLGIIHRDISPSNILVSNEGEIKIIDFGIAKNEQRTQESTASMVQGKFAYMSPEQARGAHLDARTDLFSVGLVLYELLTGVRPFEGNSDLQSIERIKTLDPPKLSRFRDNIPEDLEQIIQKSLQKDRDKRYQSADEFYDALESFLRANGMTPHARDIVTDLFPVLAQDALVVRSSEDFFDEAFQALLDDQARQDQSARTRSMCLTSSFSKALPKAGIEDFNVTGTTLPKYDAISPTETTWPKPIVPQALDLSQSATAATSPKENHAESGNTRSSRIQPAAPSDHVAPLSSPVSSAAENLNSDDLPVIADADPVTMTRRRHIHNMWRRIRYILIGFTLALIACFFVLRYFLLNYDLSAFSATFLRQKPAEAPVEPVTANDDTHTLPLDAEFATQALDPEEEARKRSIDLTIKTTPEDARLNVIQASYSLLEDHHITLIADNNAEFEIESEGYEACHFNLIFDDSLPRLEWQHCAGVSTKYAKDFRSAVIEITLTKHTEPPAPAISPVNPLPVSEQRPTHASASAHTSEKSTARQRTAAAQPQEPEQHRISVRANMSAVLSLSGTDYALPTEVVARSGESASIRPIVHHRDIAIPYVTHVTDKAMIEVSFCRALIHISEFYIPGDTLPYQVANIQVDGVTYAKNTDMASFLLPCGSHTFSAEYQSGNVHLTSDKREANLKPSQTYRGVLSLKYR